MFTVLLSILLVANGKFNPPENQSDVMQGCTIPQSADGKKAPQL
jgi:hypothetical protein